MPIRKISANTVGGFEAHAVSISLQNLVDVTLPWDDSLGILPGSYEMRLKAGVTVLNARQLHANINDPFVKDGLPNCGVFEYGEEMSGYSPQTERSSTNSGQGGCRTPAMTPLGI